LASTKFKEEEMSRSKRMQRSKQRELATAEYRRSGIDNPKVGISYDQYGRIALNEGNLLSRDQYSRHIKYGHMVEVNPQEVEAYNVIDGAVYFAGDFHYLSYKYAGLYIIAPGKGKWKDRCHFVIDGNTILIYEKLIADALRKSLAAMSAEEKTKWEEHAQSWSELIAEYLREKNERAKLASFQHLGGAYFHERDVLWDEIDYLDIDPERVDPESTLFPRLEMSGYAVGYHDGHKGLVFLDVDPWHDSAIVYFWPRPDLARMITELFLEHAKKQAALWKSPPEGQDPNMEQIQAWERKVVEHQKELSEL
jgi:hypothetical protein